MTSAQPHRRADLLHRRGRRAPTARARRRRARPRPAHPRAVRRLRACASWTARAADPPLPGVRAAAGRARVRGPAVLAVGGELKNTFCLTDGALAHVSAHVGDMGTLETLARLRASRPGSSPPCAARPPGSPPTCIPATSPAPGPSGTPGTGRWTLVQHHHAHVVSLLAEHGRLRRADRRGRVRRHRLRTATAHDLGRRDPAAGPRQPPLHPRRAPGPGAVARRGRGRAQPPPDGALPPARRRDRVGRRPAAGGRVPGRRTTAPGVAAGHRHGLRADHEHGPPLRRRRLPAGRPPRVPLRGRSRDGAGARSCARRVPTAQPTAAPDGRNVPLQPLEVRNVTPLRRGRGHGVRAHLRRRARPRPVLRAWSTACGRGPLGALAFAFHVAVADAAPPSSGGSRGPVRLVGLTGGVFQNVLLLRLSRDRLTREGFTVFTHRPCPRTMGGWPWGRPRWRCCARSTRRKARIMDEAVDESLATDLAGTRWPRSPASTRRHAVVLAPRGSRTPTTSRSSSCTR